MKRAYLDMSADISPDGLYRYWLSRRLSMGERTVLFVGLNPSTADASQDDPTIRRCVGFARDWGYDWLFMANLYAYRSTDPAPLKHLMTCPIGPRNEDALRWLRGRADLIVAAWGNGKHLNDDAKIVANEILKLPRTKCFGVNTDGTPKHPLYLPKSATLTKWPPADRTEQP